jgi:integrase
VKSLPPGRYTDGQGLQLLVKSSGARSWVMRYRFAGQYRDTGLGNASGPAAMSLADARKVAASIRAKIVSGIDPVGERKAVAAKVQADAVRLISFRDVAESYLEANADTWRNEKHRSQWYSTLAMYVYPVMGDLPIAEVDTQHVMAVIEPIWKTKPETASRVRGRIEIILDAGKVRGYRSGDNPARWRNHLALILPKPKKLSRGHHKALPYREMPTFIERLRERQAVAAMALEFTILTAARTGETIGARWQEIDFERALWVVPANRMKAYREHRVPLCERAIEILRTVKGLGSDYLFPSPRGGAMSNMAMNLLLRRMDVDVTVHGFRSVFRDWVAECTAFDRDAAEMALAHSISNATESAYRRGDMFEKRRAMMAAWEAYCDGRAALGGDNVRPIQRLTA